MQKRNQKWIFLGVIVLSLSLTGCQKIMDRYVESYLDRNAEKIAGLIPQGKQNKAKKVKIEDQLAKAVKVSTEGHPFKGAKNAVVEIVEFSDFECPFCARVLPTLDKILKTYPEQVKVVYRHNPLSFHKNAMKAARASVAAHNQGKFWEMHDILFKNQKKLKMKNIRKWAKKIGLDMKKFNADYKSAKTVKKIKADMKFAKSRKAHGTPAFFVNGVLISGAQPFEQFKSVIDVAIRENKKGTLVTQR